MTTAKQPRPTSSHRPLDLDSFLLSHGTDLSFSSSSDDDDTNPRRRTVDDILNDSSSSSSPSSSPPKPQAPHLLSQKSTPPPPAPAPETLAPPPSTSALNRRSSLPSRLHSSPAPSRPLPPLFTVVRPTPKPGAALAAAAAASRPVPSPHAAAIKSRRAATEDSASDALDDKSAVEGDGEAASSVSVISRSSSEHEVAVPSADEEIVGQLEVTEEDATESVLAVADENAAEVDDELPDRVADEHAAEVDGDMPAGDADPELAGDEEEPEFEVETDADIESEIDRLVEERLEEMESSKKAEKELRASMTPLELAEEREKRQATSGMHWEEGAAAQPMRLEGIRRGPPAVGYLQMDLDNVVTRAISSQAFRRDHGSPHVVAVHMNFIAMGTSRGTVLIVPSKYSPHSADSMDSKMMTLGSHGERSQAPVTSMCFSQQGDLLLVGYGDGHLTFWDVPKAMAVKVIYKEHSAPVMHTLFLGQDSQATRQFKAVTGDSTGLFRFHAVSVVPIINRFNVYSQPFIDGQKMGIVVSACPLLMDVSFGVGSTSAQGNLTVSTSGISSMVGGVVGGVVGGEAGWKQLFSEGSSLAEEGVVIFATLQNALVVRLSANDKFSENFSRPDGAREGSMPYTAWKSSTCSNDLSVETPEKISWLAIAWDRTVQVAKLVKSEMKRVSEWNLDSAAIGVAWLDDQMLLVLTLRGQLCLFAKDGNELHRTSFIDGSGIDDIITYHTQFSNIFGNPEKAYHNSVAVRGASIYILGPMHLMISRLLPWNERIQVLQRAGDWMGALDMAMRLYDGHAHGVIDLPRTVDAIRDTIMPYLVELLLSYVDEVFSYISVAFSKQSGNAGEAEGSKSTDSSLRSDIEEQYARVGGVAVEFCVHIKRTDILFDDIFSRFVAVQHGGTFLEILEPYILRDMLGSLPPEIMQALVQHYSSKGWLQRVEQCVLHMDISSLDFNQIVKLCREHGLYGALIYVFNRGLNDFRAPLEELLAVIQDSPIRDVAALGYRMLVYLKYCFQGLAFPPGHGDLPRSCLWSVKVELLQFLLEDFKSLNSQILKRFKSLCGSCPYLLYFLWLDTEATLEVLKCAFIDDRIMAENSLTSLAGSGLKSENGSDLESIDSQNDMAQRTTDILISVLDLDSDELRSFAVDASMEIWPPKSDLVHLLEFIAFLVSSKGATISGSVLKHILEYLMSEELVTCSPDHKIDNYQREKQVLSLLKVVPRTDWSASYVLHLCTEAHFYKACGLIHNIGGQFIAALDSYMMVSDEPVYAFAFINKMLLQLTDGEASSFVSAVISRMQELVKLSREFTFILVVDHFSSESQHIISKLHAFPESLFLFLKTAVDVHLFGTRNISVLQTLHASDFSYKGTGNTSDELEAYLERLSTFPKLLQHNRIHVTDEMAELYLELLCQYERKSVLKFLETFENYRLEHCLRLCQEYGVTDAAVFLLERVGDVGSALALLMSGLNEKIDLLIAAVENTFSEITSSNFVKIERHNEIFELSEVACVQDVLRASVGLCQRNSKRLNSEESESLWFQLLDSFSEPLRRFSGGKEDPEKHSDMLVKQKSVMSRQRQRFSYFHMRSNTLRRIFTQFIGEIIDGMAGYLPLPAIMAKLLSENENQEFGDFKLTILRMLGTYGFEKRILDTAKSLIEEDTFSSMSLLKKGASHAYAPQGFVCCICSSSLTKESSSSGIRVFSCGHATHLHCESGEGESSNRDTEVGCPICLPKKNPRARSKSVLVDDRLVNNSTATHLPTQGVRSIHHLHESDVAEKAYGVQQMSRFEILTNLRKPQTSFQLDTLPRLKLSPPAIYHEKVHKGSGSLTRESSNGSVKNNRPTKSWQPREMKSKGLSNRIPFKSNILGLEKNKVR